MTTREKFMQYDYAKRVLESFEKNIGEVDIVRYKKYYLLYPKGKKPEYENLLTTLEMTSIESVVSFMQGALFIACQNGKNKLKKEND